MAPEAGLLAALAFIGALVVGVTGFGSALVMIPRATHFVPLQFAQPLWGSRIRATRRATNGGASCR
ncbi:MAG TPA: hypothetical protein VE085_05585 [Burkholderiales bacterium]|nr:hypothetical protein [Burkholderiales bacterium]